MSTFSGSIDADLHGLADGQIEPMRRVSALRRLAASPSDRARVEGWQAQNDMLRSAFAGIEREPVPAMLDLRARPQLHCIPANDAPLVAPAPEAAKPRASRLASIGALVVIVGGLVASWLVLSQAETDQATAGLRDPAGADLARWTSAALTPGTSARSQGIADLPTTRIPDLGGAGFRFIGAETNAARPASILFRYRNDDAERLVVSVARTEDSATSPPTRVGRAVSWQTGDTLFVLAGTPGNARLQAIAVALQQTTP